MMTLFPYNMVLNPRVGPDQLAIKLAKVFGVDYVPEKPKSKLINEIKPKITNKRKKHLYLANTIDNHRKPKNCVHNVEIVEEIEIKSEINCHHVYEKKCHTTYVTKFHNTQVEKCDYDFTKECEITYEEVAENQTQVVCQEPLSLENCAVDISMKDDEVECQLEYETQCIHDFEQSEVVDKVANCQDLEEKVCQQKSSGYSVFEDCTMVPKRICDIKNRTSLKRFPSEKCKRVAQKLCFPRTSNCIIKRGKKHCQEKIVQIVSEKPTEKCSVKSIPRCWKETEIVPSLEPVEECLDVPREVCSEVKSKPKKILKPQIKKDCHKPQLLLSVIP